MTKDAIRWTTVLSMLSPGERGDSAERSIRAMLRGRSGREWARRALRAWRRVGGPLSEFVAPCARYRLWELLTEAEITAGEGG